MTTTPARSDATLRTLLLEELDREAGVDATRIGVGVTDGAVTLAGEVTSYPQKRLAEKAVQRVPGVHAIAEQITVRSTYAGTSDTDIARAANTALGAAVDIASDAVTATVSDHVVTLSGEVPWHYQREAAVRSVRHLKGVHDVRSHITVTPVVSTIDLRQGIEDALVRHAVVEARRCTVTAGADGEVTITGTVGTWAERRDVDVLAWATPGVCTVHNRLRVAS